jgi:hypothetical protein
VNRTGTAGACLAFDLALYQHPRIAPMPKTKPEGDKKHGDELESLIERTGESSVDERDEGDEDERDDDGDDIDSDDDE